MLLPRELAKYSFTKVELTDAAIFGLSRLPAIHRDLFDRILVVQAKLTGCTRVTPDQTLARYPVEVFW